MTSPRVVLLPVPPAPSCCSHEDRGILAHISCSCACHVAPPITEAALVRTVADILGERHLS